MRNKRWKRQAKRLKGYCLSVECENCKYWKDNGYPRVLKGWNCNAVAFNPGHRDLRSLEKDLKCY